MNDTIIYIMAGICILAVSALIFSKPLKLLLKALINSGIGLFAIIGMNFLLAPFDIAVGVNALTLIIIGVLGIPGFISLYFCQLLL